MTNVSEKKSSRLYAIKNQKTGEWLDFGRVNSLSIRQGSFWSDTTSEEYLKQVAKRESQYFKSKLELVTLREEPTKFCSQCEKHWKNNYLNQYEGEEPYSFCPNCGKELPEIEDDGTIYHELTEKQLWEAYRGVDCYIDTIDTLLDVLRRQTEVVELFSGQYLVKDF